MDFCITCSIENGICHIRSFSSCATGLLDHGLEHLGRADNGLAGLVALRDHLLLCDEDLNEKATKALNNITICENISLESCR